MIQLLSLALVDFCCYEAASLNLHNQGLVFISGNNEDTKSANSNGSGKTTLFKGLSWALFDECVDGDSGDEVIRRDPDTAEPVSTGAAAILTMAIGDEVYRIDRRRKVGRPLLTIELIERGGVTGFADPVPGSRKELNEWIIAKMGMDFHAFKNTVLYGQGDVQKFAHPRTRDGERKAMLHRVLRTDVLQVCHEVARERAKATRKEQADAQKRIDELSARLDEVDMESIETQIKEWDEDRDERVAALVAEAKQLNSDIADARASAPEPPPDRSADVKALKDKIKAAEDAQTKLEKQSERLDKLKDDIHDIDKVATQKRAALAQANAQVSRFDKGLCPVCTTPTSGKHIAEHIGTLKADAESIDLEIKAMEKKLRPLERERDQLKATIKQLRRDVEPLMDLRKKLRALESQIADEQTAQDEHEQEISDMAERALQKVNRAKELRKEVNPHTESLAKAKKRTAEIKAESKAQRKTLDEINERLSLLDFWVRGYGPSGMPSFVLDSAMGPITERANHYLEMLADGDITVNITTQRELKGGETRDEIEVDWDINALGDTAPSGGQWMRITLAVDFALMDLCGAREGGRPNILMIDEVMDGLDAEGVERVCHLLYKLRKRVGSIFVISHSPAMSEVFERELVVTMRDKVATLS